MSEMRRGESRTTHLTFHDKNLTKELRPNAPTAHQRMRRKIIPFIPFVGRATVPAPVRVIPRCRAVPLFLSDDHPCFSMVLCVSPNSDFELLNGDWDAGGKLIAERRLVTEVQDWLQEMTVEMLWRSIAILDIDLHSSAP